MSITYSASEYKPKGESKKKELPLSGGVVMVEVLSPADVDFDWAGTKETVSKRSGRKMLQVHLKVCPNQIGEGCWIIDYILLDSDFTASRIGQMLDALGFDVTQNRKLNAKDLCGLRGYVRVKHEEYEGEPRARVAQWVSGSTRDRMRLPDPNAKRAQEVITEGDADSTPKEDVPF